jgi:hypothetical protein
MSKSHVAGLLTLGLAATLAGCQSTSLEDAAPKAQAKQTNIATDLGIEILSPVPIPGRKVDRVERQQFVEERINQSGEFPLVGVDREAAMQQLSDEDAAALESEFDQYRGKTAATGQTDAEYRRRLAELRKTAQTHARDTEKQITK